MEELWFEDELSLSEEALEAVSGSLAKKLKGERKVISAEVARQARGIVRALKPDWAPLSTEETKNILASSQPGRYFKVRLVYEFEIPRANFDQGARFVYSNCEAHLWAAGGQAQPEVYDVFPMDIYEGEPQKVSLKFGPEITVDKVGVSVGEIGTEIAVGQIAPVMVGFFGDEKREPHWELRPKTKSLHGRQYFWLTLSCPQGCEGIRLASRVTADIQTQFGPIGVGPKDTLWDNRPSIVIA